MQQIATDLILLHTSLSQLKNAEGIKNIYIEAIQQIFENKSFRWQNLPFDAEKLMEVCTRSNIFGGIEYDIKLQDSPEEFALFQNSAQLLAIILENLENEKYLNDQKNHLQHLVEEHTNSLIEKQAELNEINEEYATLNEELIKTNRSLLELNSNLVNEITEHEKTLVKLRKSENYFKNIFNHAAVGKSITSLNGNLQVNDSFCEILGYSHEELAKLNWREITHPDDIEYNARITADILSGKYSKANWNKRYIHKNGNIVWVNISTSLQRDAENKPEYFITTVVDITEQKEIQEKLRESNEYLENLFKYSNSPIMVWDYCFVITQFNPAFEKLSGFKASEVIGKNIDVLFSANTIEHALKYFEQAHEGKPFDAVEIEIACKNGQTKTLVWNSAAIYNNERTTIVATIAIGTNISEMKHAMKELKLAEKRLKSIIDGTQAGTWEWNVKTGKTIFNEKWAEIIGYSLEELQPVSIQTWIDYAHPEDLLRSNELIEKHFKGEIEYYECESRMKHKNGYWVWVLDRGKVTAWDANGQPKWMSGTHQDITERKQIEIGLRDSEQLLNESQEISLIGSYILDMKDGMWYSSSILNEIFGIKASDDHSIEGWLNLIHPDDREMMNDYFFDEVIGMKKKFDKEYRIISVIDQKEKWVHGIGELEFDYNDAPTRMIGTIQDISERKKVMNELFESNELLSHFVLHSPIYAYIKEVTPNESRVIKASENYIDMIGIRGSEMVGKNMFELFPKDLAASMTADDWNVVSNGISLKVDEELNGRYYTSIKFPIKLNVKNLLAGYTIDITERKQSELLVKLKNEELVVANRKLKKAKEKAEESDRLKTSFLANMSHEIRTPLNSIMGFASLLPEEESKELIDQYSHIIEQNSEQLLSIIDGIVLYSKLQTGLLTCYPSQFLLSDLCTDIFQSFNLPEYNKSVTLIISPDNDLHAQAFTDYDKLRQLLTNLISNAFKYTSSGSITVVYKNIDDFIEFKVKDTGIGIPQKEMKHIFDRFYRGTNVEQSRVSGTGLGLSIVKELVELLGGKIWAKSKIDKGTSIYFTISKTLKTI